MVTHLNIVCEKYEYALVELQYNNGFLIPKEVSPSPSLTPEEAYKQRDIERPERKEKYPLANPYSYGVLSLSKKPPVGGRCVRTPWMLARVSFSTFWVGFAGSAMWFTPLPNQGVNFLADEQVDRLIVELQRLRRLERFVGSRNTTRHRSVIRLLTKA